MEEHYEPCDGRFDRDWCARDEFVEVTYAPMDTHRYSANTGFIQISGSRGTRDYQIWPEAAFRRRRDRGGLSGAVEVSAGEEIALFPFDSVLVVSFTTSPKDITDIFGGHVLQ